MLHSLSTSSMRRKYLLLVVKTVRPGQISLKIIYDHLIMGLIWDKKFSTFPVSFCRYFNNGSDLCYWRCLDESSRIWWCTSVTVSQPQCWQIADFGLTCRVRDWNTDRCRYSCTCASLSFLYLSNISNESKNKPQTMQTSWGSCKDGIVISFTSS